MINAIVRKEEQQWPRIAVLEGMQALRHPERHADEDANFIASMGSVQ